MPKPSQARHGGAPVATSPSAVCLVASSWESLRVGFRAGRPGLGLDPLRWCRTLGVDSSTVHRAWLILLAACSTGPVAEPAQADGAPRAKPADKPADLAVEYRRTPCFGQCPIYQVTIQPSGMLRYFGRENVAVPGEQTKQLTRHQMHDLAKAIERSHFFRLDDQGNEPPDQSCRKPGGGTCSFSFSVCTDSPHTIITVTRPKRGGSHTIDDAHCTDTSAAEELERTIDTFVKSWVGQ
ncbi:hypothetical protein BH11MYX1_BH11MYX1_42840 [soil metagenome]